VNPGPFLVISVQLSDQRPRSESGFSLAESMKAVRCRLGDACRLEGSLGEDSGEVLAVLN
jgi:hypothetical protein